jgi:hypothetical protein
MAAFSHFSEGSDDEETRKKQMEAMRGMFSPAQVEQAVGQAISMCWMMLPPEKKNVGALVEEMRRIFERSIKNLQDDARSFGVG